MFKKIREVDYNYVYENTILISHFKRKRLYNENVNRCIVFRININTKD